MTPEERELRINQVTVGFMDDTKEVCVITLPVKRYVDDIEDGGALLHGHIYEIEVMVRKAINEIRVKKPQVLGIDGKAITIQ